MHPLFLETLVDRGAKLDNLKVKMAGGANVLDRANLFNVGKRNYLAARKILYHNNLLVEAESIGGVSGKTLRLHMNNGDVVIRLPNGEEEIL